MAKSKVNQVTSTAIGTYNGVVGLLASVPLAGIDVASSAQKAACGITATALNTAGTTIRNVSNVLKMNGGR
jgi:hypothetical protein